MKSTIPCFFLLVFFMIPKLLVAQEANIPKNHSNELGMDITSIIRQFFFINNSDTYQAPRPNYLFTYKRLMKQYSFRLGIGGNSYASKTTDKQLPDQIKNRSFSQLDIRIGLEKNAELSKHWCFHYGFDVKHTIFNNHDDRASSGGGWASGWDFRERKLALAPTVMMEFKINPRLSLQTETNFAIYFSKSESQYFVTRIAEQPSSPAPSNDFIEERIFGAEFAVPRFLILAVKI